MQLQGIRSDSAIAGGDSLPSPRLVRAAHEFEGQMMKELLKPLTDSDGLTGDDTDGGFGSGGGVLGEFAGEALGQALSQRGGFGIADRIIGQLMHSVPSMRKGSREKDVDNE